MATNAAADNASSRPVKTHKNLNVLQIIRRVEKQVENETSTSSNYTPRPESTPPPLEISYSPTLNPDSPSPVKIPSTSPESSPIDHLSHLNSSNQSSTFEPFEDNPSLDELV